MLWAVFTIAEEIDNIVMSRYQNEYGW